MVILCENDGSWRQLSRVIVLDPQLLLEEGEGSLDNLL
jgi:hypothetical protein